MLEALLKVFSSIQTSAFWPGLVQMLSQAARILFCANSLLVQGYGQYLESTISHTSLLSMFHFSKDISK